MIKAKAHTKVKTYPNAEKFLKEMKKIKGSYVSIGIHEGAGQYADGTSVIQVGFWNEFGTEHIPSRPFMRNVVYGKEGKINQLRDKLLREMVEGKLTLEKALGTIGFQLSEMIKNEITGRHLLPDKPSTIESKRKQGVTPPDTPLYETGLLLRSITFQVVIKGAA